MAVCFSVVGHPTGPTRDRCAIGARSAIDEMRVRRICARSGHWAPQDDRRSCLEESRSPLPGVRGWAEIPNRPPKLRDRSRNRRSPHDGHGAAKRRRSHASPNAIAARPVRGAMFSARRRAAQRAVDGRARDHRGGVLPRRLASRPAALSLCACFQGQLSSYPVGSEVGAAQTQGGLYPHPVHKS